MRIIKSLLLVAVLIVWQISNAYPVRKGFSCKQEQQGMFEAAQAGKIDVLRLYQKNKCSLKVHDAGGFSLYDIAALHGKKEVVQWLIKQRIARKDSYTPALYKLLQTGLRFLNHDAGIVNGKMNNATAQGIKSFQRHIGQKTTGKPSIDWLPVFYTQMTKKMQLKLGELGYHAGKADGIIGSATRSAIKKFQQERKIVQKSSRYINDRLIYQLMMAENEAHKKAIARKNAGNKTPKTIQKPEQKPKAKSQQVRTAEERYATENAATNALLQAKREPKILLIRQAKQPVVKKLPAEKTSAAPYSADVLVRKEADNLQVKEQGKDKKILKNNVSTSVQKPKTRLSIPGYQKVYGKLVLKGSGGHLTSCSLAGNSIDITWCQQYYPSGNGKSCRAVLTNKGGIISLVCK